MNFKHGQFIGGKPTSIYLSWIEMLRRCNNTKHPRYKDYGGRGIAVCDRWLNSFMNFLADMGKAPKGLTLDRKDNDGNYELGNCRWATPAQQAQNSRNAKLNKLKVSVIRKLLNEGTLTQNDIAEIFNVDQTLISLINVNKAWK